jgi:hypothetical protein
MSAAVSRPSHFDTLLADVDEAIQFAKRRATVWAIVFYTTRILIVLLSIVASAKAIPFTSQFADWQAGASLLVALLAGLDSVLKSYEKYNIHYLYDDEFHQIRNDLIVDDPDRPAKLTQIAHRIADARKRYRDALFHS